MMVARVGAQANRSRPASIRSTATVSEFPSAAVLVQHGGQCFACGVQFEFSQVSAAADIGWPPLTGTLQLWAGSSLRCTESTSSIDDVSAPLFRPAKRHRSPGRRPRLGGIERMVFDGVLRTSRSDDLAGASFEGNGFCGVLDHAPVRAWSWTCSYSTSPA
jgi:hypothetical protein